VKQTIKDMNLGEIIDNDKIGQRSFDPKELAQAMMCNAKFTIWSWGAKNWTINKDLWLRFKVNGFHHKGLVYIVLGWNDTFTLYYTNNRGKIVDKREEVYIDELVQVIDSRVEKLPIYK